MVHFRRGGSRPARLGAAGGALFENLPLLFAVGMASVGPCFLDDFYGDQTFRPLLDALKQIGIDPAAVDVLVAKTMRAVAQRLGELEAQGYDWVREEVGAGA